jgi:hypothetical protein
MRTHSRLPRPSLGPLCPFRHVRRRQPSVPRSALASPHFRNSLREHRTQLFTRCVRTALSALRTVLGTGERLPVGPSFALTACLHLMLRRDSQPFLTLPEIMSLSGAHHVDNIVNFFTGLIQGWALPKRACTIWAVPFIRPLPRHHLHQYMCTLSLIDRGARVCRPAVSLG